MTSEQEKSVLLSLFEAAYYEHYNWLQYRDEKEPDDLLSESKIEALLWNGTIDGIRETAEIFLSTAEEKIRFNDLFTNVCELGIAAAKERKENFECLKEGRKAINAIYGGSNE